MEKKIFIEGLGWVIELTRHRLNEYGINEPYNEYIILTKTPKKS